MKTVKLPETPEITIDKTLEALSTADLNDLCDATDQAIMSGGGFGWTELPSREILERYWQGVITVPGRLLILARLDSVICGTTQLIMPPRNNQAQSFSVQMTSMFVTPWARKYGVGTKLLKKAEQVALTEGFDIINLDVRETQTAAIHLCETSGYQLIGKHPCYAKVDGEIIPGRYYYKQINNSPEENIVDL